MDAKRKILIQNLYLISENVFLGGKLLDLEIWILLKFMVHVTTFYICKYFSISSFFILFLRFNSVIFFIVVRYDFKFNFIPRYLLVVNIPNNIVQNHFFILGTIFIHTHSIGYRTTCFFSGDFFTLPFGAKNYTVSIIKVLKWVLISNIISSFLKSFKAILKVRLFYCCAIDSITTNSGLKQHKFIMSQFLWVRISQGWWGFLSEAWSPLPSSLAITEFNSLWLNDTISNRKDSTDTPWCDLAIEKCKNHHLILLVNNL